MVNSNRFSMICICIISAIASIGSASSFSDSKNDSSNLSHFFKSPYFSRDFKPFVSRLNPLEKIWSKQEIFNESEILEEFGENKTAREYKNHGCSCENYRCRCCSHIEFKQLRINETGCLNLIYIPENIQLDFSFDINGKVYYNDSFSVQRDKYLCFPSPFWVPGKLCLKFYDLNFKKRPMSGCVDIAAFLVGKELPRVKLGCFEFADNYKYSEKNVENVRKEGGMVAESYHQIIKFMSKIAPFYRQSNDTSSEK